MSNDDPGQDSPYNYTPSKGIAMMFIVLFAISTVIHLGQAIRSRTWWLLPTLCLAGAGEVAGWVGRLWSSYSVTNSDAFMLQICATILAPTPMVAANFIILGRLIGRLGSAYSRLPTRWYTIIFLSCDIIALVVQGAGGGIASSSDTDGALGSNIMLAGIVFQLVAIIVFSFLAVEYFWRYSNDRPVKRYSVFLEGRKPIIASKLMIMTAALAFNTTCLLIRGVYRTIELADGWNGRVISTEVYFNVLDGGMVLLALCSFNFAHPGVLLRVNQVHSEESVALKTHALV